MNPSFPLHLTHQYLAIEPTSTGPFVKIAKKFFDILNALLVNIAPDAV
jgi:hypothetical protein